MFNFKGCKCPICQQPFNENDDIVVCPECGAPYHRDCYQEHGGCVFTDRHAPGFEWKPAPGESVPPADGGHPEADQEASHEIPCPVCGAMNPESSLFCETCGAAMRRTAPTYGANPSQQGAANYGPNSVPTQDPFNIAGLPPEAQVHPEEELDGIKAKVWADYLGNNSVWYLLNFKQMCATGRKFALCFSAFLFGPFYFLYRKMWLPAAGLFAASLILDIPAFLQMMSLAELPAVASISPQLIATLAAVSSTLSLIIKILCGAFSVNLYKNISAKRIRKLLENGTADPAALRKAGGTSKTALVISILAVTLVSYLITFLLLGPALFPTVPGISL